MSRRYRMSAQAKADLRETWAYIRGDNPVAAARWVQRLRARARAAGRDPGTGRKVPECDRDDVREVFVGTYRIVYRVSESEVLLLFVMEGHKQLGPGDD